MASSSAAASLSLSHSVFIAGETEAASRHRLTSTFVSRRPMAGFDGGAEPGSSDGDSDRERDG